MFKIKQQWIASEWEARLDEAGLLDIEALTTREFDWFEAPNHRRGGWSGVSRITLNPEAPEREQRAVFLKIQQNHFYIAPNTYFKKRLTFEREFSAMRALKPHCEAIPELVMFATWETNGDRGCVLITESLDDWLPLGPWLLGQEREPVPEKETLHLALGAIAATAREINQAGWIHMCFSAKHIFVQKQANGQFKTSVVDLEKTRKRIGLGHRTVRDCSYFLRHTPNLSEDDKVHFLKAYFETEHFTPEHAKLIRRMRGAPQIESSNP
jgi:hypothetical protein